MRTLVVVPLMIVLGACNSTDVRRGDAITDVDEALLVEPQQIAERVRAIPDLRWVGKLHNEFLNSVSSAIKVHGGVIRLGPEGTTEVLRNECFSFLGSRGWPTSYCAMFGLDGFEHVQEVGDNASIYLQWYNTQLEDLVFEALSPSQFTAAAYDLLDQASYELDSEELEAFAAAVSTADDSYSYWLDQGNWEDDYPTEATKPFWDWVFCVVSLGDFVASQDVVGGINGALRFATFGLPSAGAGAVTVGGISSAGAFLATSVSCAF